MTAPASTLAALRRGDLAGAREIRFGERLAAFPEEIFALADTLEVLDLSGAGLVALPDDMGRLTRLRAIFCSGNRFPRLPPALGACPALSQIGCRGSGLEEVPAESLPPRLRWLTLTDNRIAALPDALGERPALQKLMLAGNRLTALPERLAGAENLELIRLAANAFAALPPWLPALPRLAWAAFAGNPCEADRAAAAGRVVPWTDLEVGATLGEGASGHVRAALWRDRDAVHAVAVKTFKGAMTSDGLPEREMAASLAAGPHPNLTGALGRVAGLPGGAEALVMPRLPEGWTALAGPPSLASCSRDVYAPDLRLALEAAPRLLRGIASAAAHLHARGILHGDLYAHNILWDGAAGAAVLSDFGAASTLPGGREGAAWRRVETRAFGVLLGEVLDRCPGLDGLRGLARACEAPGVAGRPELADIERTLAAVG